MHTCHYIVYPSLVALSASLQPLAFVSKISPGQPCQWTPHRITGFTAAQHAIWQIRIVFITSCMPIVHLEYLAKRFYIIDIRYITQPTFYVVLAYIQILIQYWISYVYNCSVHIRSLHFTPRPTHLATIPLNIHNDNYARNWYFVVFSYDLDVCIIMCLIWLMLEIRVLHLSTCYPGCFYSGNTWLCVHWQLNTREWCH